MFVVKTVDSIPEDFVVKVKNDGYKKSLKAVIIENKGTYTKTRLL
ncbi:hypothetical protein JCM19376_37380 [Fusibacter bizertensis]